LHRFLRFGAVAALGLAAVVAAGADVDWRPNEAVVAPQYDLLDPEFSQTRAQIAWVDSAGSLWLASVNRDTGMIEPANGKGTLIDADAMTSADLAIIGNGPEWLRHDGLDQIVYTKFVPGRPHTRANARLALAAQRPDGSWGYQFLGNEPRNAPYASKDARDRAPRISYVDPFGNHYWRDVYTQTETLVAAYPRSYYSMRFVQGERATVFLAPAADGSRQVFRYALDTQTLEQITFDSGHDDTTNVPWMWRAPDFGNGILMATLVDHDKELRVYAQLDPSSAAWSVVYSAREPSGGTLGSPEPFVHDGKSYLFMHATAGGATNPSRIFLSNVDAANPMFVQLTPDLPQRTRRDPEVFVTRSGPKIYFNRLVPLDGACPGCPDGIFMTDTGLGAASP
jgi:hypothetical protein